MDSWACGLSAVDTSQFHDRVNTACPVGWVHWPQALAVADRTPGRGKHTANAQGSLLRGSGTPKPGSCGAFVAHSRDLTITPREPLPRVMLQLQN